MVLPVNSFKPFSCLDVNGLRESFWIHQRCGNLPLTLGLGSVNSYFAKSLGILPKLIFWGPYVLSDWQFWNMAPGSQMGEASQRHFSQGEEFGLFQEQLQSREMAKNRSFEFWKNLRQENFCPGCVYHEQSWEVLFTAIFCVALSDMHFP